METTSTGNRAKQGWYHKKWTSATRKSQTPLNRAKQPTAKFQLSSPSFTKNAPARIQRLDGCTWRTPLLDTQPKTCNKNYPVRYFSRSPHILFLNRSSCLFLQPLPFPGPPLPIRYRLKSDLAPSTRHTLHAAGLQPPPQILTLADIE
jgi:hypothetical protein